MIKGKHLTWYGNVGLIRMFCEKCKCMSIVIDNRKQCCNRIAEGKVIKRQELIIGRVKRDQPSSAYREKWIAEHGDRCHYCGKDFGVPYLRRNKIKYTVRNWDHFIPYSYTQKNIGFILSCNICNQIKSNKIFDTIDDVRKYIKERIKEKSHYEFEKTAKVEKVFVLPGEICGAGEQVLLQREMQE